MTTTTRLSDPSRRKLRNQLDTWREDLVAVDRRQRLIYFKHTVSGSLEITTPSVSSIMSALDRSPLIGLECTPEAAEDLDSSNQWLATAPIRVSGKTAAKLRTSLVRQHQQSLQTWADRGYWTLYLGLGSLHWKDLSDGREVESPLLLCPVKLEREGSQAPFRLTRTEDDIVANPALRVKLERDFDVTLPEVDSDLVDPVSYLRAVAAACSEQAGWSVHERVVMTLFSFHKEAIFRDLTDHQDQIMAHDLVQRIALGTDAPHKETLGFGWDPRTADLDSIAPPERSRTILDADTSQRACIAAARDGRSFVMDGPPGTGKSQTIANMMAELMAQGRSVLFVSEKAAALDVVRDRLAAAGLEHFLLELHSHHATRKEVVAQLAKALSQRFKTRKEFTDANRAELATMRQGLTDFAQAMNERRAGLDRSLMDALGELLALQLERPAGHPNPRAWAALTAETAFDLRSTAEQLGRVWRPATEGDDFLWRDITLPLPEGTTGDILGNGARAASESAAALNDRGLAVDADLALQLPRSLADHVRRRDLLLELETQPDHLDSWLTSTSLRGVRDREESLRSSAQTYLAAEERLREAVGDGWTAVDPEVLPQLRSLRDLPASERANVWPGGSGARVSVVRRASDALGESLVPLADIVEQGRQLAAILGIPSDGLTVNRISQLVELATLGESTTPPENTWLNPAVQNALDESSRVLHELVSLVKQRRDKIASVFTPEALDVDLAAFNLRFTNDHTGLGRLSKQCRADRRVLKSVTVRRKVDKSVLAALDEAVAWQQAERNLSAGESTYADRLGRYYQRTDTDFGRLMSAIETAHHAVRIAGADLRPDELAKQLAADAQQDPRLGPIAAALAERIRAWDDLMGAAVRAEVTSAVRGWPVDAIVSWVDRTVSDLAPGLGAAEHVVSALSDDLTLARAAEILHDVAELTEHRSRIFDSYDDDLALLGDGYVGIETDWTSLASALDWAERVRTHTGGAVGALTAERMRRPTISATDMAELIESWGKHREAFLSSFEPLRSAEIRTNLDADIREAAELLAEMASTAVADVDEWIQFVETCADLRGAELGPVLDALLDGPPPSDEVAPRLRWAVLQAWIEGTVAADKRLKKFRAGDRDALVTAFRESDKELVDLAYAEVVRACSDARPRSTQSAGAQLILREAQKKSRHKPIREVLDVASEIVQSLKPCFMMSPLTVSQFLPGDMRFDVVIFDEASQVLPSDAVNCIYRGRQLIVAGDDKQLPPTAFFQAAVEAEDGDDDEPDEFESILSVCKAGVLPQLPLSWHYRSQHEDLIAFSNNRFYAPDDQTLQSFPGAVFDAPDLGVELFHVPGVYRRGGARDNPIEAGAVVDRIAYHAHEHPEMSVGVVTFSAAQQDAILQAVEQRADDDPAVAAMLDDHDRLGGFFVKSIENVQGDERDLIIFSIGYGPDEAHKVSTHFGALNQKSGWRRLNVAVTRARRRVEVVSSLRSTDIPPSANANVEHLRTYLAFAERGVSALGLNIDPDHGDVESPFEEDVLRVIRSWGYEVQPQVGVSGYRIDLGVKHPDRPGEFLIGVECDGAAYHSARSARDRDRLRASVLEGLGWNLHRIWGLSWYRDRPTQTKRLHAAIQAAHAGVSRGGASRGTPQPSSEIQLEVEDFDPDAPPKWAVPYEVYSQGATTPYELRSVEARPAIRSYLTRLLEVEAPIHTDLVYTRLREAFGVGRIGSAIRENVRYVLERIVIKGARPAEDLNGIISIQGDARVIVRVPQDEEAIRSIGQIGIDELTQALIYAVGDAVSISDEAVIGAMMSVFGWRRQGNDIAAGVRSAIDRALREGYIERSEKGVLRLSEGG
ncbi:AAA domain-containing protein [Mumia flava]|uniref:AAA domain-containing protein n=1 Tax=Mumia flava TaxID=1348852 RepID=A0A2M9B725_9ACTN|nr:DUF3320 domain-containing protein [Mumia flava]PJJ53750.1 AAA domain-containing protein [Mumia flava]